MKVSLIVPNISLPTLGAAVRIARMLEEGGLITEIVGADLGYGVCDMYKDAYDFTVVPCPRIYRLPNYWWEIRRLAAALTGEVIISLKAFPSSFNAAMLAKKRTGAKVIAYLDEWDGANVERLSSPQKLKRKLLNLHHPGDNIFCPRIEKWLRKADGIVSSTNLLKNRFGGEIIPLGVDTNTFKPQDDQKVSELKKKWGLESSLVIGFGGVVRPHKGLEVYLEAVAQIKNNVKLLILGPRNEHVEGLLKNERYGRFIVCAGSSPAKNASLNTEVHNQMPLYLDMADMLVVPLGEGSLAKSQMPCKIFEAMAMAKPIVASAVSDIPEVLGGGGWCVRPDDPRAIAEAVHEIKKNSEEAQRRGRIARERCVKNYSEAVCRDKWLEMLKRVQGAAEV